MRKIITAVAGGLLATLAWQRHQRDLLLAFRLGYAHGRAEQAEEFAAPVPVG